MPVPDIILQAPFILVTKSQSPTGVTPIKAGFEIGYVEKINDTTDGISVGQYVMFDISEAKAFIYGSTVYYMIGETDFLFKEEPPP